MLAFRVAFRVAFYIKIWFLIIKYENKIYKAIARKPLYYNKKPGNLDFSRLPGLVEVRGIEPL
jgi:hypothetical protein